TNIIIFEVAGRFTAAQLVEALAEKQVLTIAMTPAVVRIVVHLDISSAMVAQTIRAIQSL
ncbi:MAG: threonine aldolase, partial [Sediminibacterium sp.]|nr:threonine aldolase [Sediminibacterium sp.]